MVNRFWNQNHAPVEHGQWIGQGVVPTLHMDFVGWPSGSHGKAPLPYNITCVCVHACATFNVVV
jgi:hypothetical protein